MGGARLLGAGRVIGGLVGHMVMGGALGLEDMLPGLGFRVKLFVSLTITYATTNQLEKLRTKLNCLGLGFVNSKETDRLLKVLPRPCQMQPDCHRHRYALV